MSDKKISELLVATTALGADLIPVVTGGVNKSLSVGILSLNLPNIGNKGITKNAPVSVTVAAIPLTASVVVLATPDLQYTLGTGADGQEVTLVTSGTNVVVPIASYFTSLQMTSGASVTMIYFTLLSKWVVKCSNGVSFT